jgi:cell division protein FtsX
LPPAACLSSTSSSTRSAPQLARIGDHVDRDDPAVRGLHAVWRLSSATGMAALSLAAVGAFAVALTAISIRVFTRAALR